MQLAAVLLAGGRASRMGGADKPLLRLHGRPLLDRVIARAAPQADALAISANGDPARFAGWGLAVLPDEMPGRPGPLAGILAGLRWARGIGAPLLLSLPADTPCIPADLAARLAAARDARHPVACAASAGRSHPAVALWPATLAEPLAVALAAGERRVGGFARAQGVVEVAWDATGGDPFFNINTPDDLARAEACGLPC